MAGSEKTSFVLYHDIRGPLELLDDEQRGKLFMAILDYSENGEVPAFTGMLQMAFAFIRTAIDRDASAWEMKRANRREAGRKGGLAKQANATNARQSNSSVANLAVPVPAPVPAPVPVNGRVENKADKPPRATRFTPPSVEEVAAYCKERGNQVEAQHFVDFYTSKGWKVGNQPMKDWKAAVRTWERRDGKKPDIRRPNDYYAETEGSL